MTSMDSAQAETNRAYELYNVGLYDDALDLLLKALHQDPSNLHASMFAAWTYSAKGEHQKAWALYKQSTTLLETSPYRYMTKPASLVLNSLPDDEVLIASYATAFRHILHDLRIDHDALQLIQALCKRGLQREALEMTEAALPAIPSLHLHALRLELSWAIKQMDGAEQ